MERVGGGPQALESWHAGPEEDVHGPGPDHGTCRGGCPSGGLGGSARLDYADTTCATCVGQVLL